MSLDTYTSPVITGHRGFKGRYTENTIRGFAKCFEAGATVIETDLWLAKDEVLVISHDVSTKRIFCDNQGNESDYNILHTNYHGVLEYLETIESHERLMTFQDVLRWFVGYVEEAGSNVHKLQLDIKRLNQTKLMKFLILDLLAVKNDIGWWFHRIQLGIWDLGVIKYINQDPFFRKYFNGKRSPWGYTQFDIFHISVAWTDSIHYINYNFYIDSLKDGIFRLKVTGISLLYISTWSTGFLTKFIPLLRIQDLKLYSWTINLNSQFDYLVRVGKLANLREYGIITDYPDRMVARKKELDLMEDDFNELTALRTFTTGGEYNEEGELDIKLSFKQRILYMLYKSFTSLSGNRRVTAEEKVFDSWVDEEKITPVRVNRLFVWVFAKCQKYGIF